MKKLTKRLLCVLLTLTMLMALCACDSLFGKPTLVGEWETYLDMTDYLNDMLDSTLGTDELIKDFSIRLIMEFDKDGTMTMTIDEDYMEDMVDDFADDFWDGMIEMYADQYGLSVSETEDILAQNGLDKQALLDEIDVESMFDDFDDYEGYWLLEENQLFLAEDENDLEDADPVEIEFDGKESFSIIDGEGLDELDSDVRKMLIPMVFDRI